MFDRNRFTLIEEGWKYATVASVIPVEPTSKFDVKKTKVVYKVEGGHVVVQYVPHNYFPGSMLDKMANAMLSDDINNFTFEDFLDLTCGIEIVHNEVNGRIYVNVANVCNVDELVDEEEEYYNNRYLPAEGDGEIE
jgi:hypothetical protein